MFKKFLSVLLVASFCISLSGCFSFKSEQKQKEEKFAQAVEILNAAENSDDYKNAITAFEELGDYEGAAEKIQEAKLKSDEFTLSAMRGSWAYSKNGEEIREYCKDLYNTKNAEKIEQWIQFQYWLLHLNQDIIDKFKETLKNPNSFTDIGSTYTYTALKSNDSNMLNISGYTLTLKYTATNSFGGAIQNTFECNPIDLEYEYESEELTTDEMIEVIMITDFNALCDLITKG